MITLNVILITAFAASTVITFLLYRFGKPLKLLDIPNERSLHTRPIPRAGGMAFVVSFLGGTLALYNNDLLPFTLFKAFWIGGVPIALTGLVDDLGHVQAHLRLFIHILLAIFVLWLFQGMPILELGFYSIHWHWIGWIIGILGLVWLLNLYNFMDGMDGLAGFQGSFVSLAAILLLTLKATSTFTPALFLLAVCILGFLVWNLPPAKIFMGDSGSGFLGYIFGVFLIATVTTHTLTPWQWLILFATFWVDATVTLTRRVLTGNKWHQAHQHHAFQHAIKRWGTKKVLLGFISINLLWLLPMALLSIQYTRFEVLFTLITVLPLLLIAFKLEAGREETFA